MVELLRHLTTTTQRQSTYDYLAVRFGVGALETAHSWSYVTQSPKGGFFTITLKGRAELAAMGG